jgi:hypothetical protein
LEAADAEADAAAVMTATEGTANAKVVDAAKAEAAKAAKVAKAEAAKAAKVEVAKAAKAEVCIRGGGIHWKRRNASEGHGSGWS